MAIITTAPGQTFDFRLLSPFAFDATYPPGTIFEPFSYQNGNQVGFGTRTYIDIYNLPNEAGYNPGLDTLLQTVTYNGTLSCPTITEIGYHYENVTFTGNWTISDGSGAVVATVIGAEASGQIVTYANFNEFGQFVNYHYFSGASAYDLFDDPSDTVTLGAGDDVFLDPSGSLWIDLGAGNDWLFAAGSNDADSSYVDTIYGGAGNDLIDYQNTGHYINAGSGNDTIRSQGGNGLPSLGGTIIGGTGDDYVYAWEGAVVVEGVSSGNDTYVLQTDATLDYHTAGAITVDFWDAVTPRITEIATGNIDTIVGADFNVIGSAFSDRFLSYTPTNYPYHYDFDGGAGDDRFELLFGGEGIDGGTGNDWVSLQHTSDQANISTIGGVTTVTNLNYLGETIHTTLQNVELIRFQDRDVSLIPRANILLTSAADVWTAPTNGPYSIDAGAGNDTLTGGNGNDEFLGGAGNDRMFGGAGHDSFRYTTATSGIDAIYGGDGDDRIIADGSAITMQFSAIQGIETIDGAYGTRILGTTGADTFDLSGTRISGISDFDLGNGNDRYIGSADAEIITGGRGNDTLFGGGGQDTFRIGSNAGTDMIDGGAGEGDNLYVTALGVKLAVANITGIEGFWGAGDTKLIGSAAADVLNFSNSGLYYIALIDGGAGNDTIIGSVDYNSIMGGAGADVLTGGEGGDTFVFTATSHSRGSTVDRITDFTQGLDQIDLSAIDANSFLTGLQDFAFIGASTFSGVAGQLRFDATSFAGETRIYADTNGDARADMEIRLTGSMSLTQQDFLV